MRAVAVLCIALFAHCFADPQPCSYPSQWESYFGERLRTKSTTSETMTVVMGNIYADEVAQRAAEHFTVFQSGKPMQITIIADFSVHAMVVVYPDTQQCQRVPLTQSMNPQAIFPDANYMSSFRWGHGDNAVTINQWFAKLVVDKPWPQQIEYYQMVTTDECVPVVEQGTNRLNGVTVDFDASFSDFNTTITNPNAFVPPAYCQGAPIVDNPGPLVQGLMMRFIKY